MRLVVFFAVNLAVPPTENHEIGIVQDRLTHAISSIIRSLFFQVNDIPFVVRTWRPLNGYLGFKFK